MSWHADSAILMIANEKCQIQCFDISLSTIRNQILNEDMASVNVLELANFFTNQQSLLRIQCSIKPDLTQYNEKYVQNDTFVLLIFENGPLIILRLFGGNGHKGDVHTSGFTADVLIQQYLKLKNVERAINVLLCLNWDVYGAMLMISLQKIANYIFKQPFQLEREAQLQKALGSFLVPVKPLCGETKNEFGEQVRDITRKFFQYMLRYKSYEKAFTLAIDINDEDLFMDLTNCAKEDGYTDLAHDAFQKAEEILARPDSAQSTSEYLCEYLQCVDEMYLKKNFSFISSDSTYSNDSFSLCNINSSEDSEMERSCHEENPEHHKSRTPKVFQLRSSSKLQQKFIRKSAKHSDPTSSIGVVKKDLEFSNYSKNVIGTLESQIESTGTSNRTVQMALPRLAFGVPEISHHQVVDVVPKSSKIQILFDYSIPDQTIGIPITDSRSYRSLQSREQSSTDRSMFKFGSECSNLQNTISPNIIHHPLISGNIPHSTHFVSDNCLVKKNITYEKLAFPKFAPRPHINKSSILSATAQHSPIAKKENGEKNKVKFSNMVTVAVVPVSFLYIQ